MQELAKELDATVDHVLEAMEAGVAHQATSLDHPMPGDDAEGASRAERMVAQTDEGFDRIDETMLVQDLLAQLPEREREVIQLRFFENLTQEEIAERIGVSQSYLSRILRRVLLDLRRRAVQSASLESDDDDLLTG